MNITDLSAKSPIKPDSIDSNIDTKPVEITPKGLRVTVPKSHSLNYQTTEDNLGFNYSVESSIGSVNSLTGDYTPITSGSTLIKASHPDGRLGSTSVTNIRYRTNGFVKTIASDGNFLYVGGHFTAVNPTETPYIATLDNSGNLSNNCNFQKSFNSSINVIVTSEDSIYIGGTFSSFQGHEVNKLAKLNKKTCQLDTTFNGDSIKGFNGDVLTLALKDNSIFVGGNFTAYRGIANSANYIAKLDINTGSIDTNFSPIGPSANGFNSRVNKLIVHGSNVFIGGTFTAYKGITNSANNLAKLNVNTGAIDIVFSPTGATTNGFNGGFWGVNALAISDNSIYVGGGFSAYKGIANSARNFAKLDITTGEIDTLFSPVGANLNGFNHIVYAIVTHENSVYVGGMFSMYKNTSYSAQLIAKLDKNTGTIDLTFNPVGEKSNGFNNKFGFASALIYSLNISNNSLLVGGFFTNYKTQVGITNSFAKLNLNSGELDLSFKPSESSVIGFNGTVKTIFTDNGKIYVGGDFNSYGGHLANSIAKFNLTTWEIDTTFSPPNNNGFNGLVNSIVVSDNAVYVGGYFNSYKEVPDSSNLIAKLDKVNGTIDTAFSPPGPTSNGFNSTVMALYLSGNNLFVGGYFSAYKGSPNSANMLAKLNALTGELDTLFSPVGVGANGFSTFDSVTSIVGDGTNIYVAGDFSSYRGVTDSAKGIAKINITTGQIDTIFNPPANNGFDGATETLHIDGSYLYVGGSFSAYRGTMGIIKNLARLNLTDGALDTSFKTNNAGIGFDGAINSITTSTGFVYVGGNFTSYNGTANSSVFLAKLYDTDASIDITFNSTTDGYNGFNSGVNSLTIIDTILYAGGSFTTYKDSSAAYYLIPISLDTGESKD
jgi:hypothetical protein